MNNKLHARAVRAAKEFNDPTEVTFEWDKKRKVWIVTDAQERGKVDLMSDAEFLRTWGDSLDMMDLSDAQYTWIKKRFGKRAADMANYGWSSDDKYYATKIYGIGVVTSHMANGKPKHSFEEM